MKRSADIKIFR